MNSCVICGGKNNKPLFAGVLRCQDCSYVFADTHLTDHEIQKLYDKGYFFGEEYVDYCARVPRFRVW